MDGTNGPHEWAAIRYTFFDPLGIGHRYNAIRLTPNGAVLWAGISVTSKRTWWVMLDNLCIRA